MNNFIVVMGMHRSGTSLVTGLINSAGYKINNNMGKDNYNAIGYYEDIDIMVKNDRLLSHYGGKWYSPPDVIPDKMYEFDYNYDAVKDPRFCLTYPAWLFPCPYKIVKVKRNKSDCVKSLIKRNGFSVELASALYDIYNKRLDGWNDVPFITINYEDILDNNVKVLEDFIFGKVDISIIDKTLNHGDNNE